MPIHKYKTFVLLILLLCTGIIIKYAEGLQWFDDFLNVKFLNFKITKNSIIKVKITGCVQQPALYNLKYSATLRDLVKKAKGVLPYAKRINLNIRLKDGEEYYIPFRKLKEGERININQVSIEVLCMIPMVNKSVAREMIIYRNKYERFEDIEELKEINGIGEKKFEVIKKFVILGE